MPVKVAEGLTELEFKKMVQESQQKKVSIEQQPQIMNLSPRHKPRGMDRYITHTYEPNCCCPFDNPESAGFVFIGSFPLGAVVMSNLFISAALLELSLKAAGCGYLFADDVDDDPPRCKEEVYGMHPANLYLIMATIAALSIACMNPFIGALIDHTRYRKHVAAGSLLLLALIQFIQISISKDTWFFVMVLQIPAIAAYFLHSATYSAYLPELSDSLEELNRVSTESTKYLFITEVSFVIVVAVLSSILFGEDDSVNTCRLSQGLSGLFLVYSCLHVYGRLLRTRKKPKIKMCEAVHRGFSALKNTIKEMSVEFPMVRRFLFGTMFLEAAMGAFSNVAAVFLVSQLGASGAEFALVVALLLISGAIFSPIADWTSKKASQKYGDEHSGLIPFCGSIIWITVVTCFAPVLMRKPSDLPISYLFAVLWGAGMGFYYSLLKPIYFFITPGGQESKFSGLFSFFQTIISWAPLLGFSIALGLTGSLAGGFIIMAIFLFIGLLFVANVDMKVARAQIKKCDELRYKQGSSKDYDDEDL